MKLVWNFLHLILFIGTFVAAYIYYENINPLTGVLIELPDWFYYFLGAGVFGVSIAFALFHVLGGSIFGMAAGGLWSGIQMGGMLGLALGVGRLWPYVLAWGLGAFFTAPWWHAILAFVGSLICFAIDRTVHYVWHKVEPGSF